MREHLPAVGVVLLVLVAGCAGSAPGAGEAATDRPNEGTVAVAGAGSAEAEPDRAVVEVAVTTRAGDAVIARRGLARNATRMREALAGIGIEDDQITTTRYDLDRFRERPRREGAEPRVRYRASHAFRITVEETDRVGRVIDTAVRNGADDIGDVRFVLSTDRRRRLEAGAREAAMADARAKARGLAAAANLTITGVKTVRTGGGAPRPVEAGATATPLPTATPAARSDVESGPVTVVATVRVVYRTAPAGGANASAGG